MRFSRVMASAGAIVFISMAVESHAAPSASVPGNLSVDCATISCFPQWNTTRIHLYVANNSDQSLELDSIELGEHKYRFAEIPTSECRVTGERHELNPEACLGGSDQ